MDIIHCVYVQGSRAQFSKSYMNSNGFAVYCDFFACVHGRYNSIWWYLNWTVVLIFTRRFRFVQNHKVNLTKLSNLKTYLIFGVWNLKISFVLLGPKHLSHNICPEPSLQFSQKISHFIHNHKLNPIKLWNVKQYLNLVVWGIKASFWQLGHKS